MGDVLEAAHSESPHQASEVSHLLNHSSMDLRLYTNDEMTTTSGKLPDMALNNRSDLNSHYPSIADVGTSIN